MRDLATELQELRLTQSDAHGHPECEAKAESERSSQEVDEDNLMRLAQQKRAQLKHVRPEYDAPCKIADGLFIGGVGAARDLKALQALGVTHVLNASPIVPCFHRKHLRYKAVVVYDDSEEDIAQFFDASAAFIARGRRKGGVMVHCYAGQSRSTTLVLAYLIAHRAMQLDEALDLVKAARPCACPNDGFLQQLEDYAASLAAARAATANES